MSRGTPSAQELKTLLFKTMRDIRSRKIKAPEANAIARNSGEIMKVVKAEITISQMHGVKPVASLPEFVHVTKNKEIVNPRYNYDKQTKPTRKKLVGGRRARLVS